MISKHPYKYNALLFHIYYSGAWSYNYVCTFEIVQMQFNHRKKKKSNVILLLAEVCKIHRTKIEIKNTTKKNTFFTLFTQLRYYIYIYMYELEYSYRFPLS